MQLVCKNCGVVLGEMTKGKIKKDSVLLCKYCYNKLSKVNDIELPDFMNDLFKGFNR